MKFENTEVWGFEHAIRGMRNPMNSWGKSDSVFGVKVRGTGATVGHKSIINSFDNGFIEYAIIGEADLHLMQALIKAGSEHRKFMRQIFVSVDITAPLYWWKEADQYKVGTVSNSCSTMHKLASTPITIECFETDDFDEAAVGFSVEQLLTALDEMRLKYLSTKDERYWKELIRWLPESWLQKRTITMNYENLLAMCSKGQRRFHKLTEWSKSFIVWARTLPYAQELIFIDELSEKSGR